MAATAASFAFRSHWRCISVDPKLKNRIYPIRNLELIKDKIENTIISNDGPVILVCVHSHAKLDNALASIRAKYIDVVSIPCCESQFISETEPAITYNDSSIWSPENKILIWKDVQ